MPGENRATQTGGSTSPIVTDEGSTCDDCGVDCADWILDGGGACLCFSCADHWEPYHLDEDLVRA